MSGVVERSRVIAEIEQARVAIGARHGSSIASALEYVEAAVRGLPDASPWQPIESAVRDCETEIDMWCVGEDGVGWNIRGILMIGQPDWVKRSDATDYFPHENGGYLTHWMPLPAAPADGGVA